jgi:HEXXH motif-containing protein
MSWSFHPDASRAHALSAEINARLLASLRYVFGEVGEALGIDAARFGAWIDGLPADARPDPLIHVLFHSIVADVQAGDFDAARAAAERMLALGAAPDGLAVMAADSDPAGDRPVALFARFADIEEANRLDFAALQGEGRAASVAMVEEALGLIGRNDPALDGELRALLSQILLLGQGDAHRFATAALSCFQNWGALIVNPMTQRDVLDVVEALAHEATHLTLFALALDEPLLLNPPGLNHYSPLRGTLRSMDGVYHATIVSARVVRALQAQAEAEGASAAFRALARERAGVAARHFDDGADVVAREGMLSPLARAVFDDCRTYVAEARAELDAARPVAMAGG